MTSDPPNGAPEAREQEIEQLAQEIGRLIQGANPERRDDLKELAFALIREELIHKVEGEGSGGGSTPAPFNPLGTGILIFCFGGWFVFYFWTGGVGIDVWRVDLRCLGRLD